MTEQRYEQVSEGMYVDAEFAAALSRPGLISVDAVFAFEGGEDLSKSNLASFRRRRRVRLDCPGVTVYLKCYDRPGRLTQLRNWLAHRRRASMAAFDRGPSQELAAAGIATPRVIAYGEQWQGLFEKRSFIITQEIAGGEALERRLPACFVGHQSRESIRARRRFIEQLADFARRFHATGLRHRDFYLSHIFLTDAGELYLIDLHRTFRPLVFGGRYRVKDIAQLHYSAPGEHISQTDRLRFYLRYAGRTRLGRSDRRFLRRVTSRAWRMADHDIRHGRIVPFAM